MSPLAGITAAQQYQAGMPALDHASKQVAFRCRGYWMNHPTLHPVLLPAEPANTPVLTAAAGGATPAMSMAGSCSVSGATPGSIMSTASAAADAAQCSVRGAFVSRGEHQAELLVLHHL